MLLKRHRKTTDGRTRRDGLLLEETPNLAVGWTLDQPWDYIPVGPFKVQRWHQNHHPAWCTWTTHQTLTEAVNEFDRAFLPTVPGTMGQIIDEAWTPILTYSASDAVLEKYGGVWYGVRAAFAEMERLGVEDPVTLAIWEATAMRTAR